MWEVSVRYMLSAKPETLYLCEFLNDLDARQIIHEVHEVAGPEQLAQVSDALRAVDAAFLSGTVEAQECLWGEENAAIHGWSPSVNWWYYRKPAGFDFLW
jgi:hypothetical protein